MWDRVQLVSFGMALYEISRQLHVVYVFYFPPGIKRLARATYAMDRWLGADPARLPPRAMPLSVSNRTSLLYVSPVSSPQRNVRKNQRPVSTVKHTGKNRRSDKTCTNSNHPCGLPCGIYDEVVYDARGAFEGPN